MSEMGVTRVVRDIADLRIQVNALEALEKYHAAPASP